MAGKDRDRDERLRRLAGVGEGVMGRQVTSCSSPAVGPGRPCKYTLETQVLVLLVKLRLDLPYRALEAVSM